MKENIFHILNSLFNRSKVIDEYETSDLILQDWNIYHTYSSFIDVGVLDLNHLAVALLESGISSCVMHKNEDTWVKYKNKITKAKSMFHLGEFSNNANVRLEVDGTSIINDINAYAQESWFQFIKFRLSEYNIVSSDEFLPEYIRADLGVILAYSRTLNINYSLYPIAKIYQNGVITISFRQIAPQIETHYSEFISGFLNLPFLDLTNIQVCAPIMELASIAYHRSIFQKLPINKRYTLNKFEKQHIQAVNESKKFKQIGDFNFDLIDFNSKQEKLFSVAQTLFNIIGYLSSNTHQGTEYVLFGQNKINQVGNYWSGRPYIFITKFKNQHFSSKENLLKYSEAYNCILGKTYPLVDSSQMNYTSDDYRYFDDYSILISESSVLYVWSKQGIINQSDWEDANSGHLIYEQHLMNELAEYGYMIHRMLLSKITQSNNLKEINFLRFQVLDFKSNIDDLLKHGELRDILASTLEKFDTSRLHEQIEKSLTIKKDVLSQKNEDKKQTANMLLTILFGLLTSTSLIDILIKPLWKVANIPVVENQNIQLLNYSVVSFVLCTMFIILILRLSDRD